MHLVQRRVRRWVAAKRQTARHPRHEFAERCTNTDELDKSIALLQQVDRDGADRTQRERELTPRIARPVRNVCRAGT